MSLAVRCRRLSPGDAHRRRPSPIARQHVPIVGLAPGGDREAGRRPRAITSRSAYSDPRREFTNCRVPFRRGAYQATVR